MTVVIWHDLVIALLIVVIVWGSIGAGLSLLVKQDWLAGMQCRHMNYDYGRMVGSYIGCTSAGGTHRVCMSFLCTDYGVLQ